MRFGETNRPLSRCLDHTEMDIAPNNLDFLRLISSQRDISSARDKGKGVLSPQQEKWLKSISIGEDGKRAPKIVELASVSTPEHPILPGGMKRFFKGEASQANDEELRKQAGRYCDLDEYEKAKGLYKKVLDNCKQKYGPKHLETARALTDLADVYAMQRKFEQARQKYQDALSIYEPVLKPDDSRLEKVQAKVYLGQKLGNHLLVKLLGRGGFANVYLGEPLDPKQPPVAVKVLCTRRLVDPQNAEAFRQQFLNEAETQKGLNHPNILRVMEYGTSVMEYGNKNEVPFLVMQYVPEGTLEKAHPLGRPLLPREIVAYVNQIADALQYLHNMGKIHLDLKPANVLLGVGGEVLLSDFGLVQAIRNTASFNALRTSERPLRCGTIPYMDPYYHQTGRALPESDQYALGVMAYQWLSGESPSPGKDLPAIAPQIKEVVFKAMAMAPKDRFGSVKEFAEKFEQACSPSGEKKMRTLRSHLQMIDEEGSEGASEQQERQGSEQNESFEKSIMAHYASLEQHQRADRYKEALAGFNKEFGLDENDTFALMSRGMTHLRLGQPEKAWADFNQVIETDRNNANAFARRGMTSLLQGQKNKALEDFDQSIQLDKNNAFALASRGMAYLQSGQKEKAWVDFNTLVSLDGSDGWAIGSRGQASQAMGKNKEALDDYEQALALDSSLHAIRSAYENLRRLKSGKWEKASSSGSGSERNRDQEEPELASEQQERQNGNREQLIKTYYESGEQYRQAGEYEKASDAFSQALKLDENNPLALASRARTYRKLSQHNESLADFSKLIDLEKNNALAFVQRGITYLRLGQPDKALEDYESARVLDPSLDKDVSFRTAHGQLRRLMSGKREEASSSGSGSGRNLDQEEPGFASGQQARQSRNDREFRQMSETRGEASSSRSSSRRNFGQEEPGLVSERQEQLEREQNANRESLIRGRYESGYQYWLDRQYEKARDEFSQVLRLDSKHARAYELRGRVYLALRQNGKALEDLDRAIELNPNSASALMSRGVAHRRLKENNKALEDFSRAIKLDDKNADAFARRGKTYLDMGQPEEALKDFSRAIDLNGKDDFALTYRGQIYQDRKEFGNALKDFNRAIELRPKNAIALMGRGRINHQLRQYPEALKDFDQLIHFFGENAVALAHRGETHQAMGNNKEALNDYRKALTLGIQDRELLEGVRIALDEVRQRMGSNRQS